jgi:hypothetical protein
MTAEQFTSEFYKLWFEGRVTRGLAYFYAQADALIAAYDKEHGMGAAKQALADAAPLSDRADVAKAMERVYKLGTAQAEAILRPIARAAYLKVSLTKDVAAEYVACTDANSLGQFTVRHSDPLDVVNLWLKLENEAPLC